MRMTLRDTFIDKPLLMNLLMFIDYDFANGMPLPAIIKPKALWTGKQVMSLIFPDSINFENSTDYDNKKDDTIVI
jgi:DNA-directed RNA polymerase II subunit RPB1